MKRFELTYGPTEFAHFTSQATCVNDMQNRLFTWAYQEGYRVLRLLTFYGETEPVIRMVAITKEL